MDSWATSWLQIPDSYVEPVLAIPFALALALVHLVAVRVVFDRDEPRRRVLSLAAGVSVSYVFVHLLPEIGRVRREIAPTTGEHHVYVVALLGFVVYYGMERFVRCSTRFPGGVDGPSPGVFWLHLGSFGLYNVLIGYLLVHRKVPGVRSLALFALAIGLHFLVNDYGLRQHYPRRYHDRGRWALATAVLLGTALGAVTAVDRILTGTLFAFLAGGIVLNTIKEELPEERESHFWSFFVGAAVYAGLLAVA